MEFIYDIQHLADELGRHSHDLSYIVHCRRIV